MGFLEKYILLGILLLALGYIVHKGLRKWRQLANSKDGSTCGFSCEDCPFGQVSSAACHERAGNNGLAPQHLSPDQQLALSNQEKRDSNPMPSSDRSLEALHGEQDACAPQSPLEFDSEMSASEALSKTPLGQLIEQKNRHRS